jgi:hypothetical protein
MPRNKKYTSEVENVRSYVEGVAKNLVDRLYGPGGPAWGTRLTELEDTALAIREILTEKMLGQALERQAGGNESRPTDYRACPSCGRSVEDQQDAEPRIVQTRVGEAEWSEPQARCHRCRRSFFPSEQEPGDRSQ